MKVIVKKYGGTSVSSVTKIKNIAKKVVEDATRNNVVLYYQQWVKLLISLFR